MRLAHEGIKDDRVPLQNAHFWSLKRQLMQDIKVMPSRKCRYKTINTSLIEIIVSNVHC